MVRLYARALKGKRARGEKPQKRGKNISLIGALSVQGVVASINIYGAVDGITFEAFVVQELIPKLWENACVVMDNAKIHQGEMLREFIEKAGAKLLYCILRFHKTEIIKLGCFCLHSNSFDYTHLLLCRNNPCELESCLFKKRSILRFCTFASAGSHY